MPNDAFETDENYGTVDLDDEAPLQPEITSSSSRGSCYRSMKRKGKQLVLFLVTTSILITTLTVMFLKCNAERKDFKSEVNSLLADQKKLEHQVNSLLFERNRSRDEIHRLNSGWYLTSIGFIYKLYENEKSYDEAEKSCAEEKSRLVSTGIKNETIWKEIWKRFAERRLKYAWIGLRQPPGESSYDIWFWSDGAPYNHTSAPWRPSEPNGQGKEHCAQIGVASESGAKLDDNKCGSSNTYICEKEY